MNTDWADVPIHYTTETSLQFSFACEKLMHPNSYEKGKKRKEKERKGRTFI